MVNALLIGTPVYMDEDLFDVNKAGYGIVDHGWLCTLDPTPVTDRLITHEELVVVGRQEVSHPSNEQPYHIPAHQEAFYEDIYDRVEYPCRHHYPHQHIHTRQPIIPDHHACVHCLYNYLILAQPHAPRPSYTPTNQHLTPTIATFADPPNAWNQHTNNHSKDPTHQPTVPQPTPIHSQILADNRNLEKSRPPPRGRSPAGSNRWGAPTAAPSAQPAPQSQPPQHGRLAFHDPTRDPGRGSNEAPPPQPSPPPPPLLPPTNQETRGRERARQRDRTPTREWTPSVDRQVHPQNGFPPHRQSIQTEDDRPKNYGIVPYTQQGSIDPKYRTDQTFRWSRAELWGAVPVNGPFSPKLFLANIRPNMSTEWYASLHDYFTQFPGVIQAEMNQRGGPPFLHVGFETHQYAVRAKHTINVDLRPDMRLYGGEDKALRATWARAPPASAPHHMRETFWTTLTTTQLRRPQRPPATHPTTHISRHLGELVLDELQKAQHRSVEIGLFSMP